MNTLLLILLLSSSIEIPSSKVADSPGAELLHRSDSPNRGGEILPDTFSLIDFGLVDKHLGAGAGKEANNLQPAPLTVSQGPESHASDGLTAYIYGEVILDPESRLDTAKLTTWPHFLSVKHDTPPPIKLKCPLVKGNLFEGSLGKQVFEFSLDLTDTVQPFSIALQTNLILDQYLIEAGDSIKVQINLRKGKILFGGPTGPKYQAQHFIRSALESSQWDQPPAMITSTSAKNQMMQTHSEMYQKAEERASSVRNSLRFIESKEDSLNWLRLISQVDFQGHPAWQILESQKVDLGKSMETILASEIAARQVISFYRFMHSFSTLDKEAFPLTQNPEQFLQTVKDRFGWSHRSPELVAALLSRSNVLAYHNKNGLFDQFDLLPPLLRDRLYGKFMVENVQKYTIEEKSFDRAIATVGVPWIQELIGEMKSHLVKGADLSSYSFLSPDDTEVSLSEFDGKLVLMNFWISGCKYCLDEFQNVIYPAEQFFQDDPRVVFLSVSADGDTQLWEKTLSQGKFTSELSQPVYAGNNHDVLSDLGISAYPKKILLGTAGQLLSFQDIPSDSEQLIRLIQKNLEPIPNL
ncbi:TlpA family protein disulfide reductase [Algoriphagus litoralis]|uniref:TlpA family protein disulfide reductase n=1 Tax=Algoriphagus litoralis TaxID=2202829 RepID=UPI000DB96547|nr:TlpA disulfide reductase family protein [Algoriphagus litoralis]